MGRSEEQLQMWLNDPSVDQQTKDELRAISHDPAEVEDRFYKDLEFGTGGLRGVMGAGTNRMNRYTVGRATQGLAAYVLEREPQGSGHAVAIAYDSRHNSAEFALETALVLAGNGIRAYLFEELRPTPELSFAVRELGASAGVVVTASHNPPEYNGYKVYGPDGGQLTTQAANEVTRQIQAIASFDAVRKLTREEAEARGLLVWIGDDIDRRFTEAVLAVRQRPDITKTLGGLGSHTQSNLDQGSQGSLGQSQVQGGQEQGGQVQGDQGQSSLDQSSLDQGQFRIVYTPLHGAGNRPVRSVLAAAGYSVEVVAQQELPDPEFSTVESPNPEERAAFALALEAAEAANADLVIGTDPDCDRMGAVVREADGKYTILTGNQTGAILVHYLLEAMKERGALPPNPVIIKTIVTSDLGAVIAESYGVEVMHTLTGFKYIGELMTGFAETGSHSFIFGYEESYGYLAGTHARDKDAVVASLLISEAAAYYKSRGQTLIDVLNDLYARYGTCLERMESRTLKGIEGVEQIRSIVDGWRTNPPTDVNGVAISKLEDFAEGLYGLPRENVIKCKLADGSWFCLRPSGTEPKIKFYFAVKGTSMPDAEQRLNELVQFVLSRSNV